MSKIHENKKGTYLLIKLYIHINHIKINYIYTDRPNDIIICLPSLLYLLEVPPQRITTLVCGCIVYYG